MQKKGGIKNVNKWHSADYSRKNKAVENEYIKLTQREVHLAVRLDGERGGHDRGGKRDGWREREREREKKQ